MTNQGELQAIARQLKAAQDEARQIAPITSSKGDFDLPAAYRVQQLIHEARVAEGAVTVGRKLGFTNPALWSPLGLSEPAWAYLYERTTVTAPTNRATYDIGRLVLPKVEPEIVVRFRSAPPVDADLEAILDSVEWVAHGFEIVQSRFAGKPRPADALADGLVHGALVVGAPQPVERLGPNPVDTLARLSIRLFCNGELRETGSGENVMGNPLKAVERLIALLAADPATAPLQAGDIVTTGTLSAAPAIAAGEVWHSELDGVELPGLAVEFVA